MFLTPQGFVAGDALVFGDVLLYCFFDNIQNTLKKLWGRSASTETGTSPYTLNVKNEHRGKKNGSGKSGNNNM